jgi:Zn-dependent M28 family amino/carboxypeptidase
MNEILSQVSTDRLEGLVRKIAGLRHGWENYDELEQRASFIEKTLRSFNLSVETQKVPFHGKTYRNLIANLEGADPEKKWLLIGAHYDSAIGSPGADDNASGTAVLLEAAGILARRKLGMTIQFAAFTLEEPQPHTVHFLIGSNHFAAGAKRSKIKYKAVFILESVGYTDSAEGSQIIPFLVGIPVPKIGNFLGVVSNSRSKHLMQVFHAASNKYVSELPVVPYKVPLSGRIIPATRFSDHTSFWNHGYPALMLTDTAMFRNPHYHTYHDSPETLDFAFMSNVAKALISAVLELDNNSL